MEYKYKYTHLKREYNYNYLCICKYKKKFKVIFDPILAMYPHPLFLWGKYSFSFAVIVV